MSANNANKALALAARKKASRRRRAGNSSPAGSAIQRMMAVQINPSREFLMDIRLGEWTVYLDNTSTLQNNPIQGLSIAAPWNTTATAADSYPSTNYVLFQTAFTLDQCAATLVQKAFAQFQIRGMEWKFEALVSDSWNVSGIAQTTSGLPCSPELLIVSEPTTQDPPVNAGELLGYSGCQRKVLAPGKVATFGLLPRAQQITEADVISPAASTTALLANNKSMWFYTGAKATFCGPLFAIRSWYTEVGLTGRGSPPIRIAPRMRVAFRQPFA